VLPEEIPMSADIMHAGGSDDPDVSHSPEPLPVNIAHMRGSYDPGGHANGKARAAHATDEQMLVDDVLDVEGATQLLRIGRNTVYELVGRNEIPHRRLGKQIRFSRAAIMRWLDSWSSQGAKEGQ
jgi:excisionase family DNA binding protein